MAEIETVEGNPGVRIEWIGERSPFDEDWVWLGKHTGKFTRRQLDLLDRMALRCNHRISTSARELVAGNGLGQVAFQDAPQLPGDDRGRHGYTWGPRKAGWGRVMSYRDADLLLSCAGGHEFVNLDARDVDEPKVIVPPLQIHMVRSEAMDSFGNFRMTA